MSCNVRTRTLFKCLVVVYISTIFVIMSKLQLDQPLNDQNVLLQKLQKMHQDSILNQNASTLVMTRNITRIVYVNKTIMQVQYKDRYLPRYGPGENGTRVQIEKTLLSADTLNRTETDRQKHGFDTLLSDIVSLQRKLPDIRPQECKDIIYPDNLPPISVVIIFRDEWPSILLRTAYSVLENSPPELIKEVVLVDDGSLNDDMRIKVDVHTRAVKKLKLVRHEKSLGLMLARQTGIEATTADYFAVMDGHMEVFPGWLEPLLFRLQQEPNALLCSHVGWIYPDNFGYFIDKDNIKEQIFDEQFPFFDPLTLDQQWAYYKDSYRAPRNHSSAPLEYGTIQGMITVMRKEFFLRLGGFDPGMKIWGAEQIELSVKVWMCGGRVEMIPCSKVLHMYRITHWAKVKTKSDYYAANKRRMIEVWLDEPYKGLVLDYLMGLDYEYGDIQDRQRIRTENKCKPYAMFVHKIMELSDVFQPISTTQRGVIYSTSSNQCLAVMVLKVTNTHKLELYNCHGTTNQYFIFTQQSQIRSSGNMLLKVKVIAGNSTEIEVKKEPTNIYDDFSYWRYNTDSTISHTATGKCLTIMSDRSIQLFPCLGGNVDQIWKWGPFNKKQMSG